ncbi:MAG: L-2-hydroxyglutarate oxidase [Ignavibacteria bacterium]|nr:L-2-hydroxyglutarate oxidase [Ignavibacteria bacterium]
MNKKIFDAIIIGGGIVGTAAALSLQQKGIKSVLVIEAEKNIGAHQTGHNSGVIHSGVYYKPGSLKAKLCSEGRELLYRFCEEHNILHQRCGKIIVATEKDEIPVLNEIEKRGLANGLKGIKRLSKEEIKDYEPYAAGEEGLFINETGIVDFIGVTNKFRELIKEDGGEVLTSCKFLNITNSSNHLIIETTKGDFNCKLLINCGGLQSDRIAKKCGLNPDVKIIPFRGEYYELKKGKEYLVNNLIYPVPDPKFPFLGVHFTRMVKGGIEAGPNAVLAFSRTGYTYKDISLQDLSEMFGYPGFWKMLNQHYAMGINEFRRSLNKSLFVKALQKLVPSIEDDDIVPGGSGVRAQALDKDGKLVDDFRIIETEKQVHVLNAPSPAATASLSIGKYIAEMAAKKFIG